MQIETVDLPAADAGGLLPAPINAIFTMKADSSVRDWTQAAALNAVLGVSAPLKMS